MYAWFLTRLPQRERLLSQKKSTSKTIITTKFCSPKMYERNMMLRYSKRKKENNLHRFNTFLRKETMLCIGCFLFGDDESD